MGQAAAVIDLESFRRKKEQDSKGSAPMAVPPMMFVPVWVCWVPYWPVG